MKKYKGIILIEVLVGLMILLIASMMAMTSIIAANKSKIKRDMYGELERLSYCIMNEIKYNYSFIEVKEKMLMDSVGMADDNFIGLKYTDDILHKLTMVNIFELEKGTDIKIEEVSRNDTNEIVNMKINIKVNLGGDEISVERNFNKSWWME